LIFTYVAPNDPTFNLSGAVTLGHSPKSGDSSSNHVSVYLLSFFINVFIISIVVRDQMFLEMQDFDFTLIQIQIIYAYIFPNPTKFRPSLPKFLPNLTKFAQISPILLKNFSPSSYSTDLSHKSQNHLRYIVLTEKI